MGVLLWFLFDLDVPKREPPVKWSRYALLAPALYRGLRAIYDFSSVFISKVCRVAYEIMQTLHPDASAYFHSLDDIYYFGGQNAHNQVAIYAHHPRTADEIPMEPGDVIGVAGNHWDGYSKGINRKLGRTGLYPSYKVKEKIETVKYPTYPEADQ